MKPPIISISVVSHNQAEIVQNLLEDISALGDRIPIELILTVNTNEPLLCSEHDYRHHLTIIRNTKPKGFGANHNAAYGHARGDYFCILNPDIRMTTDPFPDLIECLKQHGAGVVAPRIVNPSGALENSARRFPTPLEILKKAVMKGRPIDYPDAHVDFEPDWVGGMFMLFTRDVYDDLGGFDEKYFLYYEDVDLCARMKMKGYKIVLCPRAIATHDARYDSHRNIRYMRWHIRSMMRFFTSQAFVKMVLSPSL